MLRLRRSFFRRSRPHLEGNAKANDPSNRGYRCRNRRWLRCQLLDADRRREYTDSIPNLPAQAFTLEIVTLCDPEANTELSGLYRHFGFELTGGELPDYLPAVVDFLWLSLEHRDRDTIGLRRRLLQHYVLPGLVDMHVHMNRPTDLVLLLVNGVATVRIMCGAQRGLEWRDQIARGVRVGPTLFTSGPILEGQPPPGFEDVIPITGKILLSTREEAVAEVARQKAAGYDFIKVYNNLPGDVYEGLISAAKTARMPVVGHVPFEVGIHDVLRAGQHSVEHLRGYSNLLVPPEAPMQPGPDFRSRELSWQYGDLSKVADAARATKEADVYSTPTLTIQIYGALDDEVRRFLSLPSAVFMAPMLSNGLEDRS